MNAVRRRRLNFKVIALTSLILCSLVLSCSLAIRSAWAYYTWVVDDDGGGIRSIQRAIDMANDGDTILVLAGTYRENLVVNKSLSIIGENQDSTILDGSNYGILVYLIADNVTLRGLTIQRGEIGIMLADKIEGSRILEDKIILNVYFGIYGDRCGSTLVASSNVSLNGREGNWDGIFLYGSKPCILEGNTISENGNDGLRIRYSSNNTVVGNLVAENIRCGINVYSDEDPLRPSGLSRFNALRDNHVLNNSCGIRITHSGDDTRLVENEVSENLIAYNDVGLHISGSNGNLVYHNNFVNNTAQLYINESSSNSWDLGYYTGGNYWSDSNGTDAYWGSSQNETGYDGISDLPYPASSNPGEEDRYPFMFTNGWQAPPEVGIVSPLNETYRESTLPLNVTTNKPASIAYSLDDHTNVTATGNMILTDLSTGTHRIAVYANDTLGNEASSETLFTITFLGDINLDSTVNIIDVSIIAYSFGCNPESERWNPDADLDNNNIINILDLATVAKDYGKTAGTI